jgi:hypothetical protein
MFLEFGLPNPNSSGRLGTSSASSRPSPSSLCRLGSPTQTRARRGNGTLTDGRSAVGALWRPGRGRRRLKFWARRSLLGEQRAGEAQSSPPGSERVFDAARRRPPARIPAERQRPSWPTARPTGRRRDALPWRWLALAPAGTGGQGGGRPCESHQARRSAVRAQPSLPESRGIVCSSAPTSGHAMKPRTLRR